jgi:hypothetical protein
MSTERTNLIKHLEFIQISIVRMAANSFVIKGWAVTLVAAILAFTSADSNPKAASIALIPTLMFWGLDGYYLRTERLFRALYDRVRKEEQNESEVDFALDPYRVQTQVEPWWRITMSKTLVPFYLVLSLVVLCVWLGAPIFAATGGN